MDSYVKKPIPSAGIGLVALGWLFGLYDGVPAVIAQYK